MYVNDHGESNEKRRRKEEKEEEGKDIRMRTKAGLNIKGVSVKDKENICAARRLGLVDEWMYL